MGDRPPDTTGPLPGATIWRETLEEASRQLPEDTANLIAVSCDAFLGLDEDVCAALFGDPIIEVSPDPRGWGSISDERRLGNGVFRDPRFNHIAGVWFFRLRRYEGDGASILLCDWARGARNPNYAGPPMPESLNTSLLNVWGVESD